MFNMPLGDNCVATFPLIRFRYVNWHDEEHTYVVQPTSIEFVPYDPKGTATHAQAVWVLHGDVITRDDYTRPGVGRRRTFIMSKIVDPEYFNDN